MEDRQDSRKSLPDGLSAHGNLMAQQQRLTPRHGSNWRLKSRNQKRLRPSWPFSIGRYWHSGSEKLNRLCAAVSKATAGDTLACGVDHRRRRLYVGYELAWGDSPGQNVVSDAHVVEGKSLYDGEGGTRDLERRPRFLLAGERSEERQAADSLPTDPCRCHPLKALSASRTTLL